MKAINALAQGFLDGGCQYATNYPGFESQTLFSLLGGKQISINEKVAYEMAYGGSLAGKRTVMSLKSIGLNVCADSYVSSIISGVNAGLVLVVTDDMKVVGSQTRQDSRHYLNIFGGLWFEPNTPQSAYDIAYQSFELSEKFDIPIVIRLTNQFFEQDGDFKIGPKKSKVFSIPHKPEKYIVSPVYWKEQQSRLRDKIVNIERYLEGYYERKINLEDEKAVLSVGCNNEEISKEGYSNKVINNIVAYPLPQKVVYSLINSGKEIVVFEQGDPFVKNQILSTSSIFNEKISSFTGEVANIKWRNWSRLEKFFKTLKNVNPDFVVGDVTQFTVETTKSIDSCLCLGASVSTSVGLSENGVGYPFAIVGDVSFLHGGISAIYEAKARDAKVGIVIIDNGGSWCTGLQPGIVRIGELNLPVPMKSIKLDSVEESDLLLILLKMKKSRELSVLHIIIPND